MGSVRGLFVADEEEVQNALGKEVYFGEILGKHSEIYGTLTEDDLTVITKDPNEVKFVEEKIENWGYNPLEYL